MSFKAITVRDFLGVFGKEDYEGYKQRVNKIQEEMGKDMEKKIQYVRIRLKHLD